MLAIVDYGVGNLFSLKSSLHAINRQAVVTANPQEILSADHIILPGVGAFGDAVDRLRSSGLDAVVKQAAGAGKPLMGICLGMQLLFEESCEFGDHEGLGLIPGRIRPIRWAIPSEYKIPHMGWNALNVKKKGDSLLRYVHDGDCVYFVHSFYAADCAEHTVATCEYGADLAALVRNKNVCGCQFHPEKSGNVGLNILRAFCEEESTC